MNKRFELLSDELGRVSFSLLDNDGRVMLQGLPCQGKIAAQTEVMHARESLREPGRLVPHETSQGKHFVVLKDKDGSVLARSRHVTTAADLEELIEKLGPAAAEATMIDHSHHPVRQSRGAGAASH